MPKVKPKSMLMDLKNNYYTEGRKNIPQPALLPSPIWTYPARETASGHGLVSSPQPAGDQPLLSVLCNTLLLSVYGGCVGKEQ